MADALQTGMLLLIVGMITVFTVLAFVVLTAKVLITIVNRTNRLPHHQVAQYSLKQPSIQGGQDKRKIAAVVAAAFIMTKGKGSIRKIQRVVDE